MSERLPAHLEARAIMRRVEAEGGFAMLLKKGDADRGTLTLVVRHRGAFCALVERTLGTDFEYRWSVTESAESLCSEDLQRLVADRSRFDADLWLIELDVADPERFIAETTSSG